MHGHSDSSWPHHKPTQAAHTSQMGGYGSARAMCQQAAWSLEGRGRAERWKQDCEGNLNPLGAIRLSGSVYHIRRNIKLYIVLDEILTLF